MKIIGITGGIGCGKSLICEVFKIFGTPVYDADKEAKALYKNNKVLEEIVHIFGNEVRTENEIDFKKLSAIVFADAEKLAALNKIIHPKLQVHFEAWCKKHSNQKYVLKEAAILIESGTYKQCDEIILVTSPLELRIQRVMQRSNSTKEEVLARISKQLTDDERKPFVQHQIANDEQQIIVPQIIALHNLFSA